MKVEAIVERTDNGYYSIACDAQIGNFCLGGYGNSVEEAKADMAAIVKEAQEEYVKEHGTLPKNLQEIADIEKEVAERDALPLYHLLCRIQIGG